MEKLEQNLTKLADAAFRQAARKVIERARETGTPLIVWENGEIKRIPADENRFRDRRSVSVRNR
jgi:hypothetical protein